jgi:F-type H+-transporting ATPase subunit b
MPIDWFTVAAQAVNFLLLVWLLKRFLYGPILRAIDAREKRIAAELADAQAKQAAAQRERARFERSNADIERQREALLRRAADEAKAERERLLDAARAEADALRARREAALREEREGLSQLIRRRTGEAVFDIARKALSDLASESLEARMMDVFVRRLRSLERAERDALINALEGGQGRLHVRTAFELAPAQRTAIEAAVRDMVGARHIAFEIAPELVGGLELAANSHKVAWSIAEYLASLERSTETLLSGPEPETGGAITAWAGAGGPAPSSQPQ